MKELAVRSGKLPFSDRFFYGTGELSDGIPYNLYYIYFLYFLTDIAGINPAAAGTVSLIAVMWDAVTDPIVGYFSDNSKSKYGRRRPFMLAGAIPGYIILMLLFAPFSFGGQTGFIYYVIIAILFWTSYKIFVIPYFALGAELTQDFNERNTLRIFCSVFLAIAVWIASAGPMVIVGKVTASGGTEKAAWFYAAAVFGAISLLGAFLCWRFTRGKELMNNTSEEEPSRFINNFIELFRIKPFRTIFLSILFYCVNFSITTAAFVYLMSNNLKLDAEKQALYWTLFSIFSIVTLPLIGAIAKKLGKKSAFILLNIVGIAGCILFSLIGIHNFTQLLIFAALFNIGNVCFWCIGYSMMYDCCEVDEFINGKRREGAITGFSSFSQKLGSAIGMGLSGILLNFAGYNGEAAEQTEKALNGILQLNTLVPGILIAVSVIFIFLYPLNSKRFEALLKALELKRKGEPYTTEGFEEVLK